MWPGVNLHANYSEGLLIGYRCYDAHQIEPAFPFGHGLEFSYKLRADPMPAKTGVAAWTRYTIRFSTRQTSSASRAELPPLLAS